MYSPIFGACYAFDLVASKPKCCFVLPITITWGGFGVFCRSNLWWASEECRWSCPFWQISSAPSGHKEDTSLGLMGIEWGVFTLDDSLRGLNVQYTHTHTLSRIQRWMKRKENTKATTLVTEGYREYSNGNTIYCKIRCSKFSLAHFIYFLFFQG